MISEVSDGTVVNMNAQFVELQMYAPGQNLVGGMGLRIYSAGGILQTIVPIAGNVPIGESQRTILIGGGVAYDKFASFMLPTSGAVCFAAPAQPPIDCVAWGSFNNSGAQLPVGTPFPGGIPSGLDTLHRSIAAGCPTYLEASDDTNNSATDFKAAAPTPRNNSVTPTEVPCPGGGSAFTVTNLKARAKGGRATITGAIVPPAPGDQVKLTFFANGSPLRKIAKKSATLNANSEFKKRFRVPGESSRCKVQVAFRGTRLGQKKFKC
jgi:hypothetical protein